MHFPLVAETQRSVSVVRTERRSKNQNQKRELKIQAKNKQI